MKCSVIINTLNEVNNIEYLLKSLKKIKSCNEILVADMGSKDGTLDILKKYKVKILNIPYDENLDNSRKILLDKSKNEWCFLIDADEMVTSSLAKKIDDIVKNNEGDIVYLLILNYYFGLKSKYGIHFPYNTIDDWVKKRIRYINLETKSNNKFCSPLLLFIKNFIKCYFKDGSYKGGDDGFILGLTQCTSGAIANYKNKNIDINKLKDDYLNL